MADFPECSVHSDMKCAWFVVCDISYSIHSLFCHHQNHWCFMLCILFQIATQQSLHCTFLSYIFFCSYYSFPTCWQVPCLTWSNIKYLICLKDIYIWLIFSVAYIFRKTAGIKYNKETLIICKFFKITTNIGI